MDPIRVLLVDDHVLFRKGIASLLSPRRDITVVGEAGDGSQALQRVGEVAPDVILMDIDMPKTNGLEAVKLIKAQYPEVKIIMLTVSDDDDSLFQAVKHGAEGYLLKNLDPHQLFEMLEGIRRGEAPISGIMASRILQEFREGGADKDEQTEVDELTPREIEVLELVTEGHTNKEIAEALVITENTVKIHLRNILEKLHVSNRVQAAVYAVRQGLVDEEESDT